MRRILSKSKNLDPQSQKVVENVLNVMIKKFLKREEKP